MQRLAEQLARDPNPAGFKEVLRRVLRDREDRTFWYYTENEASFLGNVYERQLEREILRMRIAQITDQKLGEVLREIESGVLVKQHEEQEAEPNVAELFRVERHEDNLERIKRINEEYVRFKEQLQESRRRRLEQAAQRAAFEQQIRSGLEMEQRMEYRAQLTKKIQALKDKKEQRKQEHRRFVQFMVEYKKKKPLFVQMEDEFRAKQCPAIPPERVEKKKPSLDQLLEHEKEYMARKAQRLQKTFIKHHQVDVSYRSHFYQQEEEKMEQSQPVFDGLERRKRYSVMVRDTFKPKRRNIQDSTKSEKKMMRQSLDRGKLIEKGLEYLNYVRGLEKSRTITPVVEEKSPRYSNYLTELKSLRREEQGEEKWDWSDKGMTGVERREKMLMQSRQLELKAQRDELFVHHNTYARVEHVMDMKKSIDETLLRAMRGKLAIIKQA